MVNSHLIPFYKKQWTLMPSRYTFTAYSNEWPLEFEREAKRLQVLLGEEIVSVHHIGSTSVPGLDAKPIIDLMPLVHNIIHIDTYKDRMIGAGYKAWGEYGLSGRRYFTKDAGEFRTHNIHVYALNDPAVPRHLAFCAYLRTHLDARREYVAIKRVAYLKHPADIDAYNDSKNAWIKSTEQLVLAWYQEQSELTDSTTYQLK